MIFLTSAIFTLHIITPLLLCSFFVSWYLTAAWDLNLPAFKLACNLYIFISVIYWCKLYFWHYFTVKCSVTGLDVGRLINPAYYYYYYYYYYYTLHTKKNTVAWMAQKVLKCLISIGVLIHITTYKITFKIQYIYNYGNTYKYCTAIDINWYNIHWLNRNVWSCV